MKRGFCLYCGRFTDLTRDHVVQRSLLPGKERDDSRNLVWACYPCNVDRGRGRKPPWSVLPPETKAFVLERKGPVFAKRYFRDFVEVTA